MKNAAVQSAIRTLENASDQLLSLATSADREIQALTAGFEDLAVQTRTILSLASAIVASIESDGVRCALPGVKTLGAAARGYIEDRLHATNGILETVTAEVDLLRQLSGIARSQTAIALRTRVLTMLTNVEVGRLGAEGAGFHNLATELAGFSKSLTQDTEELAQRTGERRPAVEATRQVLSAELPHLREEFARIDLKLGDDLSALEARLTQLSEMPLRFRECVEQIATQIARVIAAIQSYDITRQQIEHVQEALASICSRLRKAGKRPNPRETAVACAGVTIQIAQLRNIRATVAQWTSQIGSCMEVILRVSASDLVDISPLVLAQEGEVRSRLAHIEQLEQEGQSYSARIRKTVGGTTCLVELLGQHVEKSNAVRQLLHLLSLNSIIEAERLGTRANAILEIGNGITGLSHDWSKITDRSDRAMQQIVQLVAHTTTLMATFSQAGDETLQHAQTQARAGLDCLRSVAESAAVQAREIEAATGRMQAFGARTGESGALLQASYLQIDAILADIEQIRLLFETEHPEAAHTFDADEMARVFSASYTTQVERDVLHAALHRAPPPPVQQDLGGNDIELF